MKTLPFLQKPLAAYPALYLPEGANSLLDQPLPLIYYVEKCLPILTSYTGTLEKPATRKLIITTALSLARSYQQSDWLVQNSNLPMMMFGSADSTTGSGSSAGSLSSKIACSAPLRNMSN